jgi:hypothetical protein
MGKPLRGTQNLEMFSTTVGITHTSCLISEMKSLSSTGAWSREIVDHERSLKQNSSLLNRGKDVEDKIQRSVFGLTQDEDFFNPSFLSFSCLFNLLLYLRSGL